MRWEFEPGHSAAEFCCRHMMVTWIRGHFKNVRGSLEFDPQAPDKSSVRAEMDGAAVWTGEKDRDEHLRAAAFLDAGIYPKITFESKSVDVLTAHEWRVNGDLTLRGVTRPVTLKTQYLGQWETPYWEGGADRGPVIRAGFCATTVINRHDFGVSWNALMDRGGVVVGDEVYITLDIEALRKK
ncbi:MAG: YceI family protein [Candidatus Tectomicrobia bacterium]|uniref:YceI family protein n=1 Tax=Tectimicrobiota bacterium TaxID=2528274 RepID=A0A932M0U9_UNCTE|nr:YceI family protein [Candidatus Tectomicrobia bacterium]